MNFQNLHATYIRFSIFFMLVHTSTTFVDIVNYFEFLICFWQIQRLDAFRCAWRFAMKKWICIKCTPCNEILWLPVSRRQSRYTPTQTSLLVRNFLDNNNTEYSRLGPLRHLPVSKTEEPNERTEICYNERFRRKSSRLYQKVLNRSASRIGKSASTSVLYLRGITFKGTI